MIDKCIYCIGNDKYNEISDDLLVNFGPAAIFCPYCGRCLEKIDYKKKQKPTVRLRENGLDTGETEEHHPAYAQLQFSRQSGGCDNLYGSAVSHQETISMRVSRSYKHVSNYSERYFAEHTPIIEIRMTHSQFSQAITSMNMGSGVPVTLEMLKGQRFPRCEEKTVSEIANDGLDETFNNFADKISKGERRLHQIIEKKGTILKKEREEIINIYNMLMQELRDNIPFLHKCMVEAYEKTAQSSKADIEAFYTNAIMRMGEEAINHKKINHILNDSGSLDIIDVEEI